MVYISLLPLKKGNTSPRHLHAQLWKTENTVFRTLIEATAFLLGINGNRKHLRADNLQLSRTTVRHLEVRFFSVCLSSSLFHLIDTWAKLDVVLFFLLCTAAVLGARFRGADSCLLADANGNLDPEAPPANYGRRRSRAVLYQLSGHYKQDKIKTKLKLNNVSIILFRYFVITCAISI